MLLANNNSFIYQVLKDICNPGFDSVFTDFLTKPLTGISSEATGEVVTIMQNSVFSIGAALLVIFMLIELCSLMGKISTDNSQLRGIQIPANILIKFAILAFLFCHSYTILNGIQEIAVKIADNIQWNGQINTDTQAAAAEIYALIDKENIFGKIFVNLILILEWLILKGILISINVAVYFRIFEIWVMIAFAPIPLSTIASSEFKGVCFNYLKSFAAVSLQSAVIVLCLKLYGIMVSSEIIRMKDCSTIFGFLSTVLGNNIIYMLVLGISVLGSGRLAKSIIQAQ